MNAPTILGPRQVDVASVDKELEKIWKSIAPPTPDETQAVMQASVVNLVAVTASAADADAAAQAMAWLMSKAPCRFIVLDSQPDSDPPSMEAFVSVMCEKTGERQVCCEVIRVSAKGIAADALPAAVEAFYAPDLPIMLWWSAPLNRPDLWQFAASADRVVLDSMSFGPEDLRRAADLVGQSRKTRTAVSDLNWARLTPYRQLFAQFFDSAERRRFLEKIESVTIEARESAGVQMAGWLMSRLNRPPYVVRRDQITVRVADDGGLVFRSIAMKCEGAEFSVIRRDHETVEAHSVLEGETVSRVARISIAPLEKLLSDEIGQSGRDRAYDAAVRVGVA